MIGLAVTVAGLIGLTILAHFVRDEAGGIRNALSPSFWHERSIGYDEYEPDLAWFRRGPREKKEVCLTLDDGPHGLCTQQELAILKKEGVRATFFVVGKRMVEHPALIKRMIAEGHEVGNHTQNHPRLSTIPLADVRRELEQCNDEFVQITGRRMALFRPPGMRDNKAILELARSMGYQTVDWNVGAHDFTPNKKDPKVTPEMLEASKATPDQIADRVVSNIKNGSLILLHDQLATAAALPKIIHVLRAKGYKFVTCSEALTHIDHPIMVVANPMVHDAHLAANIPSSKDDSVVPAFREMPASTPESRKERAQHL
ncbi:polysaccharide deacetylase family protein [Fimbriimonas ginsengisoli]|uniref:Polysaccharide deacetylase n=1 Tax=Fimbriimonas ginsengisoli Gsoil 348 TaxID=661478 RepID=A0A068NV46_FIMGI|nr:polysaccharide deacetylase family protein [Fimbriimonas ginsengisoli]AIE87242.1 polysaccharide deacetylase [Fimbriimonas ginsengisoli Gsoil 348]